MWPSSAEGQRHAPTLRLSPPTTPVVHRGTAVCKTSQMGVGSGPGPSVCPNRALLSSLNVIFDPPSKPISQNTCRNHMSAVTSQLMSCAAAKLHCPLKCLNSTQLSSTHLNSPQVSQLISTQLKCLNSTQLNSSQLSSTHLQCLIRRNGCRLDTIPARRRCPCSLAVQTASAATHRSSARHRTPPTR